MKRRRVAIQLVEIAHQALDAGVLGLLEQMPRQADVVIPFGVLGEFACP